VENSPRVVLGHGKRWFGLAVAVFSSNRQLTVRAIYNRSPTVLRVKTGSRHPGETSCAGGQAREAMVRRGGSDSALTL
jgi:hypothetical protein